MSGTHKGIFYRLHFQKKYAIIRKKEVSTDAVSVSSKWCLFQTITIDVENGVVQNVSFVGGCNGNLQGIGALVKGMKIEDVITRLEHIRCNGKPTSCPDQLAQALKKIQAETA